VQNSFINSANMESCGIRSSNLELIKHLSCFSLGLVWQEPLT